MERNRGSAGGPKKVYTDEFRRSVVDHLLNSSGKTIAEVAREFGVGSQNLRQWKLRYGPAASPVDTPAPQTPEELARENEQLRKELGRVIMQRDILKKTIVIVSEQSNRDIT